jgi:hypothetical protein
MCYTEPIIRAITISSALLLALSFTAHAEPQPVAVSQVSEPSVDGDLSEWGREGWTAIPVKPAMDKDADNFTGEITVEMKTAVSGDMFYLAAKWPDDNEDLEYKNWVWKGKKYKRDKKLDDMFAVRFYMSGDYDESMITEKTYTVDVWLWSAGRSNSAGRARDMWHHVTTKVTEDAAEYKTESGKIVYIKKHKDEGTPSFDNNKIDRKSNQGKKVPSFALNSDASGSVTDVQAKGVWKDGYWHLEMSRKLDTGHSDDAAFVPGNSLLGAIAVFNKAEMEHKSTSGDLSFQF